MLHTTFNNSSIANWENVSHTIAWVDDSSSQILFVKVINVSLSLSWSCHLSVESKCGLHTNKESLDIKRLKHDLGHLLSVFRGVHWWFSQNKFMFAWFATDERVDRFMPKLFNSFPVVDLTMSEQSSHVMSWLFSHSIVADIKVQVRVMKLTILLEWCTSLLLEIESVENWVDLPSRHWWR